MNLFETAAFYLKLTTKEAAYAPFLAATGGALGAGVGAGVGALAGGEGHRGRGALIGGVTGGVLGTGAGALGSRFEAEIPTQAQALLHRLHHPLPSKPPHEPTFAELIREIQEEEAAGLLKKSHIEAKEAALGAAIGAGVGGLVGGGMAWNAARPREGGKSTDQVAHENTQANEANSAANKGKEHEPSWLQRTQQDAGNWAAAHPLGAAGIGAAPGAAGGAITGHLIEQVVKEIMKQKAARDLLL